MIQVYAILANERCIRTRFTTSFLLLRERRAQECKHSAPTTSMGFEIEDDRDIDGTGKEEIGGGRMS